MEQRKSAAASKNAAESAVRSHALVQDDRFKQLDANRFDKKGKKDTKSTATAKTPLPAGIKIKKASSKPTAQAKQKKK